jgi:peptidoglycan hydrolase CwlO-like protein
LRQWIYASLAILSAAITTWVLHATQETWRPPTFAEREIQTDVETLDPEIEALEAELDRIQQRLDALRSRARR